MVLMCAAVEIATLIPGVMISKLDEVTHTSSESAISAAATPLEHRPAYPHFKWSPVISYYMLVEPQLN